jgi:hypothetical protein
MTSPFWIDGVEYWVPNGWDAAMFGGVWYRRRRHRHGYVKLDKWIALDLAGRAGV